MEVNKAYFHWHDILRAIREKAINPDSFQRVFISERPQEKRKKFSSPQLKNAAPFRACVQSTTAVYLTPRESQCMALMIRGATNAGVAESLGLSPRTIEFYVKNMRDRLNCYSKVHLIETIRETDFVDRIDSILESL